MNDSEYLTDNSHLLFAGITGSGREYGGKTSTANWLQDMLVGRGHFDYAVAFSPKGGNFTGASVYTAAEAVEAVQSGERKLEWCVRGSPASFGDGTVEEAHVEAMSFADGLNGSVVAVHDDAQMYPDSSALAWATSMGGNPGSGEAVKSLVACQNPWSLPEKSVRTNLTSLVWVGPVNENAERYFDVMQMSSQLAKVADAHDQPHMWSVVTGETVHTYKPVPKAYA